MCGFSDEFYYSDSEIDSRRVYGKSIGSSDISYYEDEDQDEARAER